MSDDMVEHVRRLVAALDEVLFEPSNKPEMERTLTHLRARMALHGAQTALAELDGTLSQFPDLIEVKEEG